LTISSGTKIWKTWRSKKRTNSLKRDVSKILVKESSKMKTKSRMIAKWQKVTTTSANKRTNKTNSRRSKVTKRWLLKIYQKKEKEILKSQMKMRRWV
jgi:hypothetical protein